MGDDGSWETMSVEKEMMAGLHKLNLLSPGDRPTIQHQGSGLFAVYRVTLPDGRMVAVKGVQSEAMARSEREGLQALSETGCRAPRCFGLHSGPGGVFLYLEFIAPGKSNDPRGGLKENLRRLYAQTRPRLGWERDNFIGSLEQRNGWYDRFDDFWWRERIEPMLRSAVKGGYFPSSKIGRVEGVISRLCESWGLNRVPGRLIHGDLWSGNVLTASEGICLIDPSVAIANPEQDLAMLDLFGSMLNRRDMEAVLTPLGQADGFVERLPFWKLYPLLVHVNLFGSGYVAQVEAVLRAYQ